MDSCNDTVYDAVLDPDEFDIDVFRDLIGASCFQGDHPVADLKLPFGLNLLFDDKSGIGGSNDRGFVPVGEFRDCTYMVKVPVSTDDSPDSPVDLLHDSIVRDCSHLDQFEGMHLVNFNILMDLNPVKPEPHIQNDNIFAYDYGSHVAAHFIVAADCNYSYFSHMLNL